jgi:hypothetical protein
VVPLLCIHHKSDDLPNIRRLNSNWRQGSSKGLIAYKCALQSSNQTRLSQDMLCQAFYVVSNYSRSVEIPLHVTVLESNDSVSRNKKTRVKTSAGKSISCLVSTRSVFESLTWKKSHIFSSTRNSTARILRKVPPEPWLYAKIYLCTSNVDSRG